MEKGKSRIMVVPFRKVADAAVSLVFPSVELEYCGLDITYIANRWFMSAILVLFGSASEL